MDSQVLALNLANGGTSFVSNFDPAIGDIDGAAPTPEPASIMLVGIGVAAAAVVRRRKRRAQNAITLVNDRHRSMMHRADMIFCAIGPVNACAILSVVP